MITCQIRIQKFHIESEASPSNQKKREERERRNKPGLKPNNNKWPKSQNLQEEASHISPNYSNSLQSEANCMPLGLKRNNPNT